MKYAVLTNQNGDIKAIISYTSFEELDKKTREQIESDLATDEELDGEKVEFDMPKHPISIERTIEIYEKDKRDAVYEEYYLTPIEIV